MFRACAVALVSSVSLASAGDIDFDKIYNAGKAIWDVVKDSKVAIDVDKTTTSASAVPTGITDWTKMTGWTPSREHRFSFKMHDPLHIPFLQYDYSVSFAHSGHFNGTGSYLAEVRLVPEQVWLNWGAGQLNATVEIRDVLNSGTTQAPVAGITVVHRFTQKNFFQTNEHEDVFFIKGTGEIICQSGPSCGEAAREQSRGSSALVVV